VVFFEGRLLLLSKKFGRSAPLDGIDEIYSVHL